MASVYLGKTEAEWLDQLNDCKAEQKAIRTGSRFVTISTGGKSYSRQVRSRDDVQADYGEALRALQVLNPSTYGNATGTVNTCFAGWQPK